jgi:nicotinamidase-related amidase
MKSYGKMNSKNTALIVIDPVNNCCHKDCEDREIGITFSKIREVVPRLDKFIDEFREKIKGKIIFTDLTPWTKKHLPANIQELYTDPEAIYYGDDSGFGEQFYKVSPKEDDIIITKNNYDTFSNLEFDKILKKNGIKYLVITGFFTDGCVLATISGGFSRGYNFVVLKDLIETTDKQIRQELCKQLVNYTFPYLYGKTVTSQEFIKSWLSN